MDHASVGAFETLSEKKNKNNPFGSLETLSGFPWVSPPGPHRFPSSHPSQDAGARPHSAVRCLETGGDGWPLSRAPAPVGMTLGEGMAIKRVKKWLKLNGEFLLGKDIIVSGWSTYLDLSTFFLTRRLYIDRPCLGHRFLWHVGSCSECTGSIFCRSNLMVFAALDFRKPAPELGRKTGPKHCVMAKFRAACWKPCK